MGQIGDIRGIPALIAAAANPEDLFVEHSTIFSLITLNQPAAVLKELSSANPKVRKAALIAMDQMDASVLRREHLAHLLRDPDKELQSAVVWVVARHPDWAPVVLRYLGERLHDPNATPEGLESVGDALVAFSANPTAQDFIAKLLAEPGLGDKQLVFLIDTIERIRLKELPASWTRSVSHLLESPRPSIRTRAVELIRSRGVPGFDEPLERIAGDATATDSLRATALEVLVARHPQLTADQFAFLTSRLSSQNDAVLRQTVARILGRSSLSHSQLLLIGRSICPRPIRSLCPPFSTVFEVRPTKTSEKRSSPCSENRRRCWEPSARTG